jgi:hypothetical protein
MSLSRMSIVLVEKAPRRMGIGVDEEAIRRMGSLRGKSPEEKE